MNIPKTQNIQSIENFLQMLTISDTNTQKSVRKQIKSNGNNLNFIFDLTDKVQEYLNQSRFVEQKMIYLGLVLLNSLLKLNSHFSTNSQLKSKLDIITAYSLENDEKLIRRGGLILIHTLCLYEYITQEEFLTQLFNKINIIYEKQSKLDLIEGYLWFLEELTTNRQNIENYDKIIESHQNKLFIQLIIEVLQNPNTRGFDQHTICLCLKVMVNILTLQPSDVRINFQNYFEIVLNLANKCENEVKLTILQIISVVVNLRMDVLNFHRKFVFQVLVNFIDFKENNNQNEISPKKLALITFLEILLWRDPIQEISSTIFEEILIHSEMILTKFIEMSTFTLLDWQIIFEKQEPEKQNQSENEPDDILDPDEIDDMQNTQLFDDKTVTLRNISLNIIQEMLRQFEDKIEMCLKKIISFFLSSQEEAKIEVAIKLISICFEHCNDVCILESNLNEIVLQLTKMYADPNLNEVTTCTTISTLSIISLYLETNNKIELLGVNGSNFFKELANELMKNSVSDKKMVKIIHLQLILDLIKKSDIFLILFSQIISNQPNIFFDFDKTLNIDNFLEIFKTIENKISSVEKNEFLDNRSKILELKNYKNQKIILQIFLSKFEKVQNSDDAKLALKILSILPTLLSNYKHQIAEDVIFFLPGSITLFESYLFSLMQSRKAQKPSFLDESCFQNGLIIIFNFVSKIIEYFQEECNKIPHIEEIIDKLINAFVDDDIFVRSHLWQVFGVYFKYTNKGISHILTRVKRFFENDFCVEISENNAYGSCLLNCNNCFYALSYALAKEPNFFYNSTALIINKALKMFSSGVKLVNLFCFNLSSVVVRAGIVDYLTFKTQLVPILKYISFSLISYSNRDDSTNIVQICQSNFYLISRIFLTEENVKVETTDFAYFLEMMVILIFRYELKNSQLQKDFLLFVEIMKEKNKTLMVDALIELPKKFHPFLNISIENAKSGC